jgi:hypothetical protein
MSGTDKKVAKPGWVKPELKDAGTIAEILKGGGGKLSIVDNDTGDVRKPKGSG